VLAIDKMPGFDSQITFESQKLYDRLETELGHDFEYRRLGSTLAVEDDEQAVTARDWVRRQKQAGLPMRYLEGQEVHDDEPQLATDIIGLVECASDSSLNPMAVVFGFVLASQRHGASVKRFTEVRSVVTGAKSEVTGVDTSEGRFAAPKVIICAGVWTPALAGTVGVNVPITPRKGQILVAERTKTIGRRKLMEFGYLMAKFGGAAKRKVEPDMEKYGIALVFEPTPHGNFLIGSSRQFVGFDTVCSSRVNTLLARRAIRFYPAIRDVKVIRSYAGLRPYTDDHLPVVSEAPEVPGLYVAAGHEGDGIGLAPVTGLLMSQMVTREQPVMPVEPLRLDRFQRSSVGVGHASCS
jgi:sarcosine oxidase subunit beta